MTSFQTRSTFCFVPTSSKESTQEMLLLEFILSYDCSSIHLIPYAMRLELGIQGLKGNGNNLLVSPLHL